ncbi:MAG: hypothetical protein LUF87_10905 [Alistipes sp.]|nr:hypothetical protein [Alistipes sp.]
MKAIHIANARKRDAEVAVDTYVHYRSVSYELPDGQERENVRVLKSSVDLSMENLLRQYGDVESIAEAIIDGDPEVDMEIIGKKLRKLHKLYVDKDNRIAYSLNLYRVVVNPDGTEQERRDLNKVPSNINVEDPLRWSGRKFPKEEAMRSFVFTKKYQLRHINGVTFDFLYNMAKDLYESWSLMLIGAGAKGNAPLILTRGGSPYRGFLEGRIDGDRYSLILHLTNIELKAP